MRKGPQRAWRWGRGAGRRSRPAHSTAAQEARPGPPASGRLGGCVRAKPENRPLGSCSHQRLKAALSFPALGRAAQGCCLQTEGSPSLAWSSLLRPSAPRAGSLPAPLAPASPGLSPTPPSLSTQQVQLQSWMGPWWVVLDPEQPPGAGLPLGPLAAPPWTCPGSSVLPSHAQAAAKPVYVWDLRHRLPDPSQPPGAAAPA